MNILDDVFNLIHLKHFVLSLYIYKVYLINVSL